MDTSGFYRLDAEELLHAPTTVMGADLELLRTDKDSYEFPVEGWYWFDSEEDARLFFRLPLKSGEEQEPWTETPSPSR